MANATSHLTVRTFRQADSAKVHQLYVVGITGYDSPHTYALRELLSHPASYLSYTLFVVGLALITIQSPGCKVLGASLSLGVATLFFGYRFTLSKGFVRYCEDSLREDLADIASHYRLQPDPLNSDELVPSGPSGFWVVERERPDKSGSEIIGCVALDCKMKDGTLQGELRRMVVSPYHRRIGIAALLIETLIAHARKTHLPSVFLTTTQFHPQARRLYRKFGWVEQYKLWVREGIAGIWVHAFQLDLTDAQGAGL